MMREIRVELVGPRGAVNDVHQALRRADIYLKEAVTAMAEEVAFLRKGSMQRRLLAARAVRSSPGGALAVAVPRLDRAMDILAEARHGRAWHAWVGDPLADLLWGRYEADEHWIGQPLADLLWGAGDSGTDPLGFGEAAGCIHGGGARAPPARRGRQRKKKAQATPTGGDVAVAGYGGALALQVAGAMSSTPSLPSDLRAAEQLLVQVKDALSKEHCGAKAGVASLVPVAEVAAPRGNQARPRRMRGRTRQKAAGRARGGPEEA